MVCHEETNNRGELFRGNFNVHTYFILVCGISNNGEFVGFRNLLNEFEYELMFEKEECYDTHV
jgi:hypothetical protein